MENRIILQIKKNIAQLETMKAKALATGKKVNGYTAEKLQQSIDGYKAKYQID